MHVFVHESGLRPIQLDHSGGHPPFLLAIKTAESSGNQVSKVALENWQS